MTMNSNVVRRTEITGENAGHSWCITCFERSNALPANSKYGAAELDSCARIRPAMTSKVVVR
jgi:hypothetical protein